MRMIDVCVNVPDGTQLNRLMTLLGLVENVANISYSKDISGVFPSLETLNRIFRGGIGGDTLITSTWNSFSIDELEYVELLKAFNDKRTEKGFRRKRRERRKAKAKKRTDGKR